MIPTITKEEFDKLPNNEKIVLICKDVLYQVERGLYVSSHTSYVSLYSATLNDKSLLFESYKGVSDKLMCTACGLGSCFLSLIRHINDLTLLNIDTGTSVKIHKYLTPIMGSKMMASIEAMYEADYVGIFAGEYKHNDGPFIHGSVMLFMKGMCKTDRLILIMNNIISNNGELVLEQIQ